MEGASTGDGSASVELITTRAGLVRATDSRPTPDLYRASIDGSEIIRLTDGIGMNGSAVWSPDGMIENTWITRIGFFEDRSTRESSAASP